MTTPGLSTLAEHLQGIDEIECVTPDLNGVPRGKVMSGAGPFGVQCQLQQWPAAVLQ